MSKILLILGHPSNSSLNNWLLEKYQEKLTGHEVRVIKIADLNFNPISKGYGEKLELETDLKQVQELITWSNELVIFTPTWWYGVPALFKGFIDRVLTPGFGFKYHADKSLPEKLLSGRTAKLVVTSGAPVVYWRILFGNPAAKMLKLTLGMCGIRVKKTVLIGGIKGKLSEVEMDEMAKKL